MTQPLAREKERQMGVGDGGSASRGSNAPRGQAEEVGQQEALLQPAGALRGMVVGQEDGWQRRRNKKQLNNQPGQTKVE
jgi:hypothetical protein